jgi:hypothetical protein
MNITQKNNFIFVLLCISVWKNFIVEGNKEREEAEFEEKTEYSNRVQGAQSRTLFKRILSNPTSSLLPYGSSYGDKTVPYGDDVSFGPIKLKDDLILNGSSYNGLFINTNGFISFEHSHMFEPVELRLIEKPSVAVLLTDFDTKRAGSIHYKEVVDNATLDLISSLLESDLNSTVSLTSALVVTWANVPLYGEENVNTNNTFQLVLATEVNCSSYSIFYYDRIELNDSMANLTIGVTSGTNGSLFSREVDPRALLNSSLPLRYSLQLSQTNESEGSCSRPAPYYDIFPYGPSNGDEKVPRGDDLSHGPIQLAKEYSFYERNFSAVYINTNGFVSFEFSEMFEPVAMSSIDTPIVAPLFDDFDTKRRGNVFYRQSSNKRILEAMANEVNEAMSVKPALTSCLIVTWDQVPTYGYENSQTKNTFQLVLGSGSGPTLFALFIYKNISLGTRTNFSVGVSNGSECKEQIGRDMFFGIRRVVFDLNRNATEMCETSPSTAASTSAPSPYTCKYFLK